MSLIRVFYLSLVGAALAVAVAAAEAGEYCVSCSGPDQSYRCEVDGGADARAWLMCITELAREGGHESCSVDRNQSAPCPGIHKVLSAPVGPAPPMPPVQVARPDDGVRRSDGPPPGAQGAAASETEPEQVEGAEGAAPPSQPVKPRVPRTVEELADNTYQASKEGLKKAGETVSSTAEKAGTAVADTAKAAGDGLSKAGSAVGNAAEKTWNCLKSFFGDC
jgi:hypothetical protein